MTDNGRPPTAAGANGAASANDSVTHELGLLMMSHNKLDTILNKRDVGPHRSGSAPPSVQGSLAALTGSHANQIPGSGSADGVAVIDSEQELRSDPAYLAYYYSHVKLNPRLPPPIVTRENYHLAQRLAVSSVADKRRLGSFDDSNNNRSLFSSHSVLPTHNEEPELSEAESSWNRHALDDVLSGAAYGANRPRSLVDLIQEDFPRTPSPIFSQLRPPSRVANEEGNDAAIPATAIAGGDLNATLTSAALGTRSATPNPLLSSRSTTPNPALSSRSATPKPGIVHMLGSSSSASCLVARAPTPEPDISNLTAGAKLGKGGPSTGNLIATSAAELAATMHALSLAGAQGSDSADKHDSHQRHPLQQNGRSQSQPQSSHQQQNRAPNASSNMQASSYAAAAAAAAAMSYMANPYYQNFQAYAPPYGLAGYAMNPPLIPAVMANYPSSMAYDTAAAAAAAAAAAVAAGIGRPQASGGIQDPLYYHYLQQYSADDARNSLNLNDPALLRGYPIDPLEMHKNQLSSVFGAQFSRNGSYGVLVGNKATPANPAYYGSPPGVGFLMPYANSPISSSMLPGSPVMANAFNLRQAERNLRAPLGSSGRSAAGGVYPNWQGQKSGEVGEEFKGSSLLEELKTNKTKKFELSDIAGHVVEFSSDQHGSRFIQQKLETVSLEEKTSVFEEVLPHALTLMTDVFGNYVIQKFFEHGSPAQRSKLAEQLASHVLTLSLQMYGCRVIQKALEVLDVEQQIQLISELTGHVMRCVRDQNGNHVIQKCIECVPPDQINFILSSFHGQVVALSTHPYGCRVIQRVLEHCTDGQKQSGMMEEILGSVCELAQDQYGNYVVQHILEHGKPEEKRDILTKMAGQIVPMSQHKFASNVVEKCLEFGGPGERQILITEMLGQTEENEPLQAMMKDQYANYVVQKVLETCDDQQREMLLSRIRVHLHALKKYTYGKHIVARVEKLVATGERRGATSTLTT